jgi:hypothetical protein
VELEIQPEPSVDERAAIVETLKRALGEGAGSRLDPWWEAGIREALAESGGPPGGPPLVNEVSEWSPP